MTDARQKLAAVLAETITPGRYWIRGLDGLHDREKLAELGLAALLSPEGVPVLVDALIEEGVLVFAGGFRFTDPESRRDPHELGTVMIRGWETESDEPLYRLRTDKETPPEPCPTCGGSGCEERCGYRGGSDMAHVGPASHRICRSCRGSGSTGTDKETP